MAQSWCRSASICVPFPFCFFGRKWNSIVTAPDHCLFTFFTHTQIDIRSGDAVKVGGARGGRDVERPLLHPLINETGESSRTDRRTYLSYIMRKSVDDICEQQRRRSACASAQSDQRPCLRCLDSIIHVVSISEISSLYLASVTAQAGLSLPWSQIPKTGFLVTRLILVTLDTFYQDPIGDFCLRQYQDLSIVKNDLHLGTSQGRCEFHIWANT